MDIDLFEKVQAQLDGIYEEVSNLSKKKPDDAINKFKLKFINEILSSCNGILGDNYKPFGDFNNFDEDDMPSNSDVVIILSQYIQCLEKLRADNITIYGGQWYWAVDNNRTDLRTSPPLKIKWRD